MVGVGDIVRATYSAERRAVIGRVVGEARNGTCWVLLTVKGEQDFHKSHCVKIRARDATEGVRGLKPTPPKAVYGDGELG